MELDRYLVTKMSLVHEDDPRVDAWCRVWSASVNRDGYDTIEMTDTELNALLPQIETMNYGGSELMLSPSLREFALTIKDAAGRGENIIVFKKSIMPPSITHTEDMLVSTTPLLDAYFLLGSGKAADVVVNMGTQQLENGKGQRLQCTYQQAVWTADPRILDDGYFQEYSRYMKFAYMLIQKALYDRPTVFREVSSRRMSKPAHSGGVHKKKKRVIKTVRVLHISSEDFAGYVKTQRVIACPCWGVIGHWRTYKSGKKVWVGPYRKGRERNNPAAYSPKEYQLMKEAE